MSRKKLFRKKLFSSPEYNQGGIRLRDLICRDCGTVIRTAEHPGAARCPKCGGKRFDILMFHDDKKEALEPGFTNNDIPEVKLTPLEVNLEKYQGKSLSKDQFTKTFSNNAKDLIEKGFASVDGDDVTISSNAYETQRLFSKLIVSVTKTLELDPEVIEGVVPKEDIIGSLDLAPKQVTIIKRAHGLPIGDEREFNEEGEEENWVEDSSIIPDLELEYNDQSFGLEQFIKILRNRYPDAPDNIIDILINKGVISVDGGQVTIHKDQVK